MLLKQADGRDADIQALNELLLHQTTPPTTKVRIQQEIRNIRAGESGEAEAAYELNFHFGKSKNWAVLHDLRLECDGRVAQIDHLLLNRFLEIYVCESKRFAEGIAINEHGEFSAFYNKIPKGVPSPIEQNKRHMLVLESVFRSGQVTLPKRLGFTLKPTLTGLVLVSKQSRITRPSTSIEGLEQVIKSDQIRQRIEKDLKAEESNVLAMAKLIGQDTLEILGRRLAEAHKPIAIDWAARFGLPAIEDTRQQEPPRPAATPSSSTPAAPSEEPTAEPSKSKLTCHGCNAGVSYQVAKFCWSNKARFGGNVFCMECQKTAGAPRTRN